MSESLNRRSMDFVTLSLVAATQKSKFEVSVSVQSNASARQEPVRSCRHARLDACRECSTTCVVRGSEAMPIVTVARGESKASCMRFFLGSAEDYVVQWHASPSSHSSYFSSSQSLFI